jgi:hypothetical protein
MSRLKIDRRAALRLGSAALAASAFGFSTPSAATAPVLVELFTSQGCNTCPPADAFLGELAQRADVVALSLHVDYWNGLGWPDPFSSPEMTQRQRAYARGFGSGNVYTPQMVVDGRAHHHRRDVVERHIAEARRQSKIALALSNDASGAISLVLPAARAAGAVLWLALFDAKHTTEIRRGENAGRTLSYSNVVREMRRLGDWDGAARGMPLAISDDDRRLRDGFAVIAQKGEAGPVLGAAMRRFERKTSS